MANTSKGNTMRHFKNPPWHPGVHDAGTTADFMPTDTKESFEKLI